MTCSRFFSTSSTVLPATSSPVSSLNGLSRGVHDNPSPGAFLSLTFFQVFISSFSNMGDVKVLVESQVWGSGWSEDKEGAAPVVSGRTEGHILSGMVHPTNLDWPSCKPLSMSGNSP